jgi:hypothetical protein
MAQGSARSGRRAPVGLETLEPRLLLTGDVSSPVPDLLLFAPAQFAAYQPADPVKLHIPGIDSPLTAVVLSTQDPERDGVLRAGSGIDLYQLSIGPATGTLRLDLTWDAHPQGTSGHLSVLDEAGNLLIDLSPAAGSNSSAVLLDGSMLTTSTVLYVGIQLRAPAGAGGASVQGAYRLQIANGTTTTASAECGVVIGTCGISPQYTPVVSTPAIGPGSVGGVQGPGAATGLESSSSPSQHVVPRMAPVPGPFPSSLATAGGGALTTAIFGGSAARAAPSPATPIDVSPLPASQYEPAGGIFAVGGSPPRVDRVEETRVEMSLVRLPSPGREGLRDEGWSSDRDSATPASPHLDSDLAPRRVVVVRVGPTSSGRSGPFPLEGRAVPRPFGPIAANSAPLAREDPADGAPYVSAATLPPIDGSDRPGIAASTVRRGDATDRGKREESGSGPGEAIVLGLGGSAVLGVGLYAPDLAAVFCRAVPRAAPGPPARSASSRDEQAPE